MLKRINPVFSFFKRANKYIIIGFVLLVIILAGLFYQCGYLPLAGRLIAYEKIELYESETYKSNDIEHIAYNPKSGMYEAIDNGSNVYQISYNLTNNSIRDEHQIDLWNNQLLIDFENVRAQMPKNLVFDSPFISGYLDGNDYSNEIQILDLSIFNEEHLTVEESEKRAAEFTTKAIELLGAHYNIKGVQIWYYDRNGGYTIKTLRNENPLNYEVLLNSTRKIDKLGENELDWISELQ